MFALGGVLGALVGVLYDGTLLPMIGVMGAASVAANLLAFGIPAGESGAGRDARG
jgi:hypothetical protein